MGVPPSDNRPCGVCGQACRVTLEGLFDDRFGAPGTYAILRCLNCGLEQTWPRPSEGELKELYEKFYNTGINSGSAYRALRERFIASGLYRLWLRWDGDMSFHNRRGAGRLLDVGCNEGRSLSLYAENGFQVEGLELNENAAALARRRGFQVHAMPLAQFRPAALYDVVVLARRPGLDLLPQCRQPLAPGVWAGLDQLACALSPLAFFSDNLARNSEAGRL
jgi:SAM-dependent methyltransferase